jgi:hypothetical protein
VQVVRWNITPCALFSTMLLVLRCSALLRLLTACECEAELQCLEGCHGHGPSIG